MNSKLLLLLRSSRINRTVSFIYMFLGSLIAGRYFHLTIDYGQLFLTYIIVGLFLYGGIYTLNNFFDYELDRRSKKKALVLPGDKLKKDELIVWSLLLIITSFVLSLFIIREILIFQFYFLLVNVIYSAVIKRKYYWPGLFLIATTGPTKFALGVYLVNGNIVHYLPVMIVHWLVSAGYHSLKWLYYGYLSERLQKFIILISFLMASIVSIYLSTRWQFIQYLFLMPSLYNFYKFKTSVEFREKTHRFWNKY